MWEDKEESNGDSEKWIEDYGERDTPVAGTNVQETEREIWEDLTDMMTAEHVGTTARKNSTRFKAIMNSIGNSMSGLKSSDNEQYREDKEDDNKDPERGKPNDHDTPGLEICSISKIGLHHTVS